MSEIADKATLQPDILLRNRLNEWAELLPQTDEGRLFLSVNHNHIQRQSFHDPDLTHPVIPWEDCRGFTLFAAENGLICMVAF